MFGIVRGMQEGKVDPKKVSGEAKRLAHEVTPTQANHFAKKVDKSATADSMLVKRAKAVVFQYEENQIKGQ